MRARPTVLAPLLGLVLALAVALPAAAYIVVLKDGSQIVADREYEVRGERAIITLPNGTRTFLDADEIDVEATRKANEQGYGTALVIEDGESRDRRPEETVEEPPQPSLTDLARRGASRLEPQRREPRREPGAARRTPAGYTDLGSLDRRPYRALEVAAEIQRFFRGQGVDQVELYQGSRETRPFAEITTASEASVFRALEVAAAALLAVRESHPSIEALEVYLTTPSRERAGQFVLTPELAAALAGGETEVSAFYVENVQF